MTVRTSAGTTLRVSSDTPVTFDAAGYQSTEIDWSLVGEITDLGEFGREYVLVTHNPVGTRSTVKKKGSYNEGVMNMSLGLDTDDAGQIILKTASASDSDYSFWVTTQNGDKYFFQAQVMNFKVGVGSVDQITSATVNLEVTSSSTGIGIIEVLAS